MNWCDLSQLPLRLAHQSLSVLACIRVTRTIRLLLRGGLISAAVATSAAAWQLHQRALTFPGAHEVNSIELAVDSGRQQQDETIAGFMAAWPQAPQTERLVDTVVAAAQLADVRIASVAVLANEPPPDAVPATDVQVELRGRYAALKAWMREAGLRHANVGILTIQIRGADGGAAAAGGDDELEASVRLRQFARPNAAAAAAALPVGEGAR